MNPRDGGLPKRPKVYISSLNLAGFAGSGVTMRVNLRGGISTQVPKSAFSVSHVALSFWILFDLE